MQKNRGYKIDYNDPQTKKTEVLYYDGLVYGYDYRWYYYDANTFASACFINSKYSSSIV